MSVTTMYCDKCGADRSKEPCRLGYSAAVEGKCPMVLTVKLVSPTDEELRKLVQVGPVYAPNGEIRRTPVHYKNELEYHRMFGFRKAEKFYGLR